MIDWTLSTLVVAGPKVLDFYEAFCHHRATSLKADGDDIVSVQMYLRGGSKAEASASSIGPEITGEEWLPF